MKTIHLFFILFLLVGGHEIVADHGHELEARGAEVNWKAITKEEWRERLTPEEFYVMREEGTEAPHSSHLDKVYEPGVYVCACCSYPLFESSAKYDSGTGWPSFFQPIEGHIDTKLDFKLVWPRTEYHCARCDAHQGHVFNDGPEPTGKRYCNNGIALKFIPESELKGTST